MSRRPLPQPLASLLAPLPPGTRALVTAARRFLRETLSDAIETVDEKARVVGYGYGPGYRGMVATLILSRTEVKIGLVRSAGFPDPEGLLAGAGKVHRHIAIRTAADLQRPGVRWLVALALSAYQARARWSG